MNFDLTEDQQMMRETFARFLSDHSSMVRVRAALPQGFDKELWQGLADLGAFSIRVPEADGGLGLGTFDACLLLEEAGRTLCSGPLAEAIIAARLLAVLGAVAQAPLLEQVLSGASVVTLAFADIATKPSQWIAGGAIADAVIARSGDDIVLIKITAADRRAEENLASTPMAELNLRECNKEVLASGTEAVAVFMQAIEEWKLLTAMALNGLSREAVRLASVYASERVQFGQLIGTFQAISHPLADCIVNIDGGKYLVWKTLHNIAHHTSDAGAQISLSLWWNATSATRAVAQALHTFGGYGLTTEYDVHLFNLRAKAWPLMLGDPTRVLEEAGRRLYADETAQLPEIGAVHIDFDLGDEARQLEQETDDFFTKNLTPELKAKAHYSFDGHDAGLHKKLPKHVCCFWAGQKNWAGARHRRMRVLRRRRCGKGTAGRATL